MIEKIVANGHGQLYPKYLAVHSTANPGASAYNHTLLWKREPKYAVHAVSDWKESYHTVPWDRLCYQVGNGNSTCIGIEICEATNEADFMRGMEIARDAIWEMLDMKGWNVDDHVRSHLWFTENYGGSDHTDPIPYLKRFGKDWDWFVAFLKERITLGFDIKEDAMQCIIKPNGEERLEFYDGVYIHPLNHKDELEAIQMVARATLGHNLPSIELGTKNAPWEARFAEAVNRRG